MLPRLLKSRPWAIQVLLVSGSAVAQRACLWGVIILLARWGSATAVGEFGLAMAIALPLARLASLQLPNVLLAHADRAKPFAVYLRVHAASNLIVALLLAPMLAWLCGSDLSFAALVMILMLGRSLEGVGDLSIAALHKVESYRLAASLQSIRSAVMFASFATAFAISGNAVLSAAIFVVAGGIITLGLEMPAAWRAYGRIGADALRRFSGEQSTWHWACGCIPLGVCSLLIVGFGALPRFAVNARFGLAAVGIFESLAALTIIFDLLCTSVARVMTPRFAAAVEQRDGRAARRLVHAATWLYLGLGTVAVMGSLQFGATAAEWIYGAEYAGYAALLSILMAARAISAVANFDACLLSFDRRRALFWTWIASSGALAAGLLILTPQLGMIGAAWAVVLANIVRCAIVHARVAHDLKGLDHPNSDLTLTAGTPINRAA
ncbi:hypothetical protein OAS39_03475 [Pirellulales bacterium]|nr:hypothetical protein [Pirellulales bacterium]